MTLTEFQADPTMVHPYYGEWFEVRNNAGVALDRQGVTFESDRGSFTVDALLLVPPDGLAVCAVDDDPDANGGFTSVDDLYAFGSGFNLSRSADRIVISYGGVTIDTVEWTSAWPTRPDESHQVSRNAYGLEWANDLSHNWCSSTTYTSSGMRGTPGADKRYCSDDPSNDSDGDGFSETEGDCDDTDATVFPGAIDDARGDHADTDDGYSEYGGGSTAAQDCDDADADIHPGAAERDDGLDNDCDGRVDEGVGNDTGEDTAADTGTPADTDTDSDADGDADTDSDTEPPQGSGGWNFACGCAAPASSDGASYAALLLGLTALARRRARP